MGWRTVVVNTHSKLAYVNNHLIFKNAEKTERLHLSEIDVLLLETTDITITTMLLKRLVDEKILVLFCDDKRLPVAKLLPFYSRHDSSLQLTRQLAWSPEKRGRYGQQLFPRKSRTKAISCKSNYLLKKQSQYKNCTKVYLNLTQRIAKAMLQESIFKHCSARSLLVKKTMRSMQD